MNILTSQPCKYASESSCGTILDIKKTTFMANQCQVGRVFRLKSECQHPCEGTKNNDQFTALHSPWIKHKVC